MRDHPSQAQALPTATQQTLRHATVAAPPASVTPTMHQSPHLLIDQIHVAYTLEGRQQTVVQGLSMSLGKGEIACLLGPSGCGKTTVLRAIAGFESLQAGKIILGGREISTHTQTAAPETRQIGVVFQDYALFPHLSVEENIAFGLRRLDKASRTARCQQLLRMVGLLNQQGKYPHELSGGQQQRVALARALAPAPDLLLLDEPFSNLDVDLRERLALEVRTILKESGTTAVLVTHDQHEAFATADMIGIMHQGKIEQWDNAYNLYHRPTSRIVADFIGRGVFLPGRVDLPSERVEIELGSLPLWLGVDYCDTQTHAMEFVDVLLREDDIVHDDASPLQARVVRKAFRGAQFLYTLALPSGQTLLALVPSHHDHAIGELIGIRLAADHVVIFPRSASPSA